MGPAAALPRPPLGRRVGHLRRLVSRPATELDALRDAYGPVVDVSAGPLRVAVIGSPDALGDMFALPVEAFRWRYRGNVLGFVVGRQSILVSDGHDWQRRRTSVRDAFRRRQLQRWIATIIDRTDAHLDALIERIGPEPTVVDMYEVGRDLVLEIVVRILFGESLGARHREIGARFQSLQDYVESPAIRQLPHPLPRTARARVRADRHALHAIIDAEIARLRADPSNDPDNVLETLVTATDLSDAEIRDHVTTLMGAGFDSTAATLAWMLWSVSLAEGGLWQRLRDEADAVLAVTGAADESHLARLALADRTMRETTRLHPANVIAPRETRSEMVLGGYRVPAGTLLLWSAYLAGRDPRLWEDALVFDPDRFLDATVSQRAATEHAWVPFGRGGRHCLGFALARMELTLIIARLAQRLEIDPVRAAVPDPTGLVVTRPRGGAPMRVSARLD